MSELKFVKMHGCGNDYIYVDAIGQRLPDDVEKLGELARRVSDRYKGVGSDGLILILPSGKGDVRMRMFNADGSEGDMCGNGIRCVAKYAWDHKIARKDRLRIESNVAIHAVDVEVRRGRVVAATVDMGEPRFARAQVPVLGDGDEAIDEPIEIAGERIRFTGVSMGNPHCVLFGIDSEDPNFLRLGPALENHPSFPDRANVEFVDVLARDELRVRVWERGSGETQACGTGACATVVAAARTDRGNRKATVHLRGGDLEIDWTDRGNVLMTGPAAEVCRGSLSSELVGDLL